MNARYAALILHAGLMPPIRTIICQVVVCHAIKSNLRGEKSLIITLAEMQEMMQVQRWLNRCGQVSTALAQHLKVALAGLNIMVDCVIAVCPLHRLQA